MFSIQRLVSLMGLLLVLYRRKYANLITDECSFRKKIIFDKEVSNTSYLQNSPGNLRNV